MAQKLRMLFVKNIKPYENQPPFQELQQVIDDLALQGIQSPNDLVDLLQNQETDAGIRYGIISILGIIKYKLAVPIFLEIARNEAEDISLRRGSLVYLASLAPKEAYKVLSDLALNNPIDTLRIMAVSLIFFIPTKRCLNLFLKLMQSDRNEIVRANAARSIGLMTRRDKAIAIQPLLTTLNNQRESPNVRAYAAEALGFIRDESAIDSLVRFLADPSPSVRYMCAYALGELRDGNYLQALEALLKDDAVFESWGTVAEAAKEAIEHLTRTCPV